MTGEKGVLKRRCDILGQILLQVEVRGEQNIVSWIWHDGSHWVTQNHDSCMGVGSRDISVHSFSILSELRSKIISFT